MGKTKVGILYGGSSVEHDISIRSARNIEQHIDHERFDPFFIGISRTGAWRQTRSVTEHIDKGAALTLYLDPSNPYFIAEGGAQFQLAAAFPILHGTDGEDGRIQGLLATMRIATVGSGVLGSAVCMDKFTSKQLLRQAGLPVAAFLHYRTDQRQRIRFEEAAAQLGMPMMVKGVNLGSSVGITRVDKEADFAGAIEEALRYDDSLLIEQYIAGREIECAVIDGASPKASTPGEVVIDKAYPFYTFEAKYVDAKAVRIETPARLSQKEKEAIQRVSVQAFEALRCSGFARVDLFLDRASQVYVNEVNTIPGFTDQSMFPMMWAQEGISFTALITQLIELGMARFEASKKISRDFKSPLGQGQPFHTA